MLAHILAIAVGLGSFALYMAAFFYPEIYRRNDFIWSSVGLFYALVLWICAGRITGGVLLGQMAGVGLLLGFGWQLLELRLEKTPREQQTEVSPQVQARLSHWLTPLTQLFKQLRTTSPLVTSPSVKVAKVEDVGEAVLETPFSEPIRETSTKIESPQTPVEIASEAIKAGEETTSKPPQMDSPTPLAESSKPEKVRENLAKKEATQPKPSRSSMSAIDDFWEDEVTIQEDKSDIPEPAIVANLEDLINLDRLGDS
ncbi:MULTISPECIES: Ycf66 family protein [Spirulina sp. CCY15215]|uniref:Ycf66 family protein n=1 Tax=Spirulina sp. CCY15215 TaxID=2767591 RepID=UPI00195092D0|nr:Ycf66 family protein [Spirulina major]